MNNWEQTLSNLPTAIASGTISPASGSAVAMTGALGAALCEMACIHEMQTDTAVVNPDEARAIQEQLKDHREQLLRLAHEDAQVVQRVFGGSITEVDDAAAKQALGVPMAIAETCLGVLETADPVIEWLEGVVAADAIAGLLLAEGALRTAVFVTDQNLELLSDQPFIDDISGRAAEIRAAAKTIDSLPAEFEHAFTSR